jgi:hypothetical protein
MVASGTPFVVHPYYTGIALAYEEKGNIADDVCPRSPVDRSEFRYDIYDEAETFIVPDVRVGRKSPPNELELTATEAAGATEDFGLDLPVPQNDIDNAADKQDPVGRAIERITQHMDRAREVRVATLLQASGSYTASTPGQRTLSGTGQWSDHSTGVSHPIKDILAAMDLMIQRPNIATIGQLAATQLLTHPDVVSAYHGNAGVNGVAPLQFVADLVGLDRIYVGQAFINSAKPGQTAVRARAWGKHFTLNYIDPNAGAKGGPTFAFSAEFGGRVAGVIPDANIGARGGMRARVVESLKEIAIGKPWGYLLINVAA